MSRRNPKRTEKKMENRRRKRLWPSRRRNKRVIKKREVSWIIERRKTRQSISVSREERKRRRMKSRECVQKSGKSQPNKNY